MATWAQGTVSVTSSSPTVVGSGTAFTTADITPGKSAFTVAGDDVGYLVASVDGDSQISLAEPYGGATQAGVGYAVNLEFTSLGMPLLDEADVEVVAFINVGFDVVTTQLIGLGAVP